MDDLISRQSAIDVVSKACFELRGVFGRCEDALKALPSAQSEQKKGKWIECNNLVLDKYLFDTNTFFRCALCAHDVIRKTKYCSECGAKMEEVE